jgi:ATP-binding protein involved in chromosome partitioning
MSTINLSDAYIRSVLEEILTKEGKPLNNWLTLLKINGSTVQMIFETVPEQAGEIDALRLKAESVIGKLKGVGQVQTILTSPRASSKSSPKLREQERLPTVQKIIAVASGKGGVGKSATATNLAIAFSQLGLKTGLLDADIYGPSLPRLFSIATKPEITADKKLLPIMRYDIACMSIGFMVAEETAMVWRGPMVHSALQQMLKDVEWPVLDVLLVDMPPGTGDAHLTLCQQVKLDGVIIVSTPQDIALIDARKGLDMFRKVGVPVLGIIENMSQFCCPNCGHVTEIFSHGGARKEAESLNISFLGEVPLDVSIRLQGDRGVPVTHAQPESSIGHIYRTIAQKALDSIQCL